MKQHWTTPRDNKEMIHKQQQTTRNATSNSHGQLCRIDGNAGDKEDAEAAIHA
jgi:hypothetical protein